jgi:hypothetical protein
MSAIQIFLSFATFYKSHLVERHLYGETPASYFELKDAAE